MRSVDMRIKAKLCCAQAERVRDDPEARRVLIEVAEVWEELAEQLEELEKRHPSLKERLAKEDGLNH
jgi:hypothetical protein